MNGRQAHRDASLSIVARSSLKTDAEAVARWCRPLITRTCPVCDSGRHQFVSHRMQHRLNLTTVVCENCSFVFTNPIPARETYERFYRDAYAHYYGHIAAKAEGSRLKTEPVSLTSKFYRIEQARPLAGCRLLEIGPGQGLFLWWARQRGCEVLGIEPSPDFCRVLAETGLPHLRGTLADVHPATAGTFDIIYMAHVLEHFYDPNEALRQCRLLLADGGILAVEVPNILKPFRSLDRYFLRYVHPSNFSPETLVVMLQKHGFQPECVDEAGENWRAPQNLFAMARKSESTPAPVKEHKQRARQVFEVLRTYQRTWKWVLAPLWYGRSVSLSSRRIVFRLARPVKQLLLSRRQPAAS